MFLVDFLLLFVLHELGLVMVCLYYGAYEGIVIKSILHNIVPDYNRTTVAQKSNIHSFGVILGAIPFLWLGDFNPDYFYGINYYALFYFLICLNDLIYMVGLPVLGYFSGLSWDEKVSDVLAECKAISQMVDEVYGGMI